MKYEVEVGCQEELKTYTVAVNPKDSAHTEDVSNDDTAVNLVFSAVQNEYEQSVRRSEKLDNKVYILLTVYAFMFVLLCTLISNAKGFSFPATKIELAIVIGYCVLLTIDIILYLYLLIGLTNLLRGVKIDRFRPEESLEADLFGIGEYNASRFIAQRYIDKMNSNDKAIDVKYETYNKLVSTIIPIIVISILLAIISIFIK